MRASDITRGDALRLSYRDVILDVTVVDVQGDKATVIDERRPGMRVQVDVAHLTPHRPRRCAYCGCLSATSVCDDCEHLFELDDLAPAR